MQNQLAQQAGESMIPQGVRNAMPTPEEARRLAKILLMQRMGTENK